MRLKKEGPADKAGIRGSNLDQYYQRHSGDMIVAIDGHNVTKAEDFMSYIDGHKTAHRWRYREFDTIQKW
jgi:S1-C subfamily serine protease